MQSSKHLQSPPILERWPAGYKSFRIDGNDILFQPPRPGRFAAFRRALRPMARILCASTRFAASQLAA
jgi:hypothetical protein